MIMWNKCKNQNGDLGMGCIMPCEQICGKEEIPLYSNNMMKDTSTIMCNPSLHNSGKRVTYDCASILDRIAKGI